MKSFVCVLLSLTLLLCLSACGGSGDESDNSEKSIETSFETSSVSEEVSKTPTETSEEDYDVHASIPGADIHFYAKDSRRCTQKSGYYIFSGNGKSVVVLAYNNDGTFKGTEKEAFDAVDYNDIFLYVSGFSNVSFHSSKEYHIEKSEEDAKIGDINAVRFTGATESYGGVNCYTYGYSFVLKNIPIVLFGIVTDAEQEDELKQNITIEIDSMLAKIRK